MPEIKRLEISRDTTIGFTNVRATAKDFDPGLAAAARTIGSAFAKVEQEQQRRNDTMALAKTVSASRAELLEQSLLIEDAAEIGAPDHVQNVQQSIDDKIANLQTETQANLAPLVIARMESVRSDLVDRAENFQRGAEAKKRSADLDATVRLSLNTIRSDPNQFDGSLQEIEGVLAASSLPSIVQAELLPTLRSQAATMLVEGLNDRNPGLARQKLESGELDKLLTPAAKDRLVDNNQVELRRIEVDARRRRAEQINEVRRVSADHIASISATGSGIDGFEERAAAVLDDDDFEALLKKSEIALQFFTVNEEVKFMPPQEAIARVAELRPKSGSADFAQRNELFDTLSRGLAQNFQLRQSDPAGYAGQAPEMQEAIELANQDPSLIEETMGQRLDVQQQMGIPSFAQKVLSKPEAKGLAATLDELPGQARSIELAQLAERYGKHWNRVLSELADENLDPRNMVLASLAGEPALTQMVAQVIDLGPQELRQGRLRTEITDLNETIGEKLQPFAEAWIAGDFTGANVASFNDLQSVVTDVALFHLRQGKDPTQAAELATRQIVTDRFDVVASDRVRAYVPLSLDAQPIDAGKVEEVAELSLTRERLEAFDPEPFRSGGAASLERDTLDRERTLATALNSGFFVTNPAGTGLILMVPVGAVGALPLRSRDDKLFEIDFVKATQLALPRAEFTETDFPELRQPVIEGMIDEMMLPERLPVAQPDESRIQFEPVE